MNQEKLLIVDEYFQVANGGFREMELALAAARKHCCRIWLCCVGGRSELAAIHRDNLQTVLESKGVEQWLTATGENAKILSDRCGDTERYSYGKSVGTELRGINGVESKRGPSVNETRGQVSRKLLLPHEAEALNVSGEQIIFFSDVAGPVRLRKAVYRDIPELARLAQPNPYYEEKEMPNQETNEEEQKPKEVEQVLKERDFSTNVKGDEHATDQSGSKWSGRSFAGQGWSGGRER